MPNNIETKEILTRTYPYFFALFPVLSLYDFNKDMSSFSYLTAPVLLIIISTTALFEIFKKLLKTPKKASLFVSFFMISFLSFGHFFEFSYDLVTKLFSNTNTITNIYQIIYYFCVVSWLTLLIVVYKTLAKTKSHLEKINILFLYTSIILVLLPLFDIGFYQINNSLIPPQDKNFNNHKSESDYSDIYYLILDGYGREDVLEKYYNFDNSSFTKSLEQKGFLVTNKSTANYPQTYLSIASSLNFKYIDSLLPNIDSSSEDRWALRSSIKNNHTYEFLNSLGYSFVVLPSIWSGTKNNLHEDYVLGRQLNGNEFNQLAIKLTPLGASLGQKIRFDQQRNITNFSFENIPNIATIEGPHFFLCSYFDPSSAFSL